MSIPGPFPLDSSELSTVASSVITALGLTPATLGAKSERVRIGSFSAKVKSMGPGTSPIQFSLLGLGDSLGHRIMGQMFPKIEATVGVAGYALDTLYYKTLAGTVVAPGDNSTPNFQPTIYDSGRVWNMSSGASISIGVPLGGSNNKGVLSNQCVIWTAKQSGGGILSLDYSDDNGSSWTSTGQSVDTNGAASAVGRIISTLGGARYRLWRVVASGGPVNLVGAKICNSLVNGAILARSANGGLSIASANQGQSAIRNQIGTDLGLTFAIMHFYEYDGEATQSDVTTYLSNWRTALGATSDIIVIGQTVHDADPLGEAKAVMEGYWNIAIAADGGATYLDTEALIPDAYAELVGWNSPDNLHKDDEEWAAIANVIFAQELSGAMPSVQGCLQTGNGSSKDYFFGSPDSYDDAVTKTFTFPVVGTGRGGIRLMTKHVSNGNPLYFEAALQASTHANIPDGMVFRTYGGSSNTLVTISSNGSVRFGPYDASFPSAYTEGLSRINIVEDYDQRGALNLNHTSATATWIQRWQLQGVTKAEMREDGELNLKTITTAASYADDSAAATAGIPVGGFYRKTGGDVVWRQA